MRKDAHTLHFGPEPTDPKVFAPQSQLDILNQHQEAPMEISYEVALTWVKSMMARTRGRELLGNYNPPLISELFWASRGSTNTFDAHDVC